MICRDGVYVKHGDSFRGLHFMLVGGTQKLLVSTPQTWKVTPQAFGMFEGMFVQWPFGNTFLGIPSSGGVNIIKMPELDGKRILDAKYENFVAIVSVFDSGINRKLVIRFDHRDFQNFDFRWEEASIINFCVLDKGAAIDLLENDSMEIFTNNPGHNSKKKLLNIKTSAQLGHFQNEVILYDGVVLNYISMRS